MSLVTGNVLLSLLKLCFIQVPFPERLSVFSFSYPCEWGGVVDGKPYLKNLEVFGRAVLEDLWTAVEQQFVEVIVSHFRKTCSTVKLVTIIRNCVFFRICKKKKS